MILLNSNLEAFLAVVEHSTVSMAAKQIGLTQTGVTQRIKSLETELGTSVFIRSRKGMRLTEEGKRLYQHCLEVKDTEGRLQSSIKGSGKDQSVSCWIAGPASVIGGRIIKQVCPLYTKWPKLNLNYIYDTNKERIELLKTGQVDLSILTTRADEELEYKSLAPWEFVLVIPYKWRRRKIENIIEEQRYFLYDTSDDICVRYLEKFKLLPRAKRAPLFVNDNQAMLELIANEIGFGVLPKEVLREKINCREVVVANSGRSLPIPMALSWYPRKEPPGYLADLIAAIN